VGFLRLRPLQTPHPGASLLKEGRSATQPDVWSIPRPDGPRAVVKTFERSPRLLRATVCRWIAAREGRNLALLDGIDGVPKLLGRPAPWAIEMTQLPAEPVPARRGSGPALAPAYFDRLGQILAEMHRRGLNHGDLRRLNLLVDPGTGLPCVLDFAQSMYRRKPGSLFDRLVFRKAVEVDRLKFLELKKWYLGEVLSPEEESELRTPPFHLRIGKFLRKRLYRPFKHWRSGMTSEQRRRRREKGRRRDA
jgi:hypothetical protein